MAYLWTIGGITLTGGGVLMTVAAWLRVMDGAYGNEANAFSFRVLRTGLARGAAVFLVTQTIGSMRLSVESYRTPRQPRPGT